MVFLALSRLFGYLYAQAPLCLVERISEDRSFPSFLFSVGLSWSDFFPFQAFPVLGP